MLRAGARRQRVTIQSLTETTDAAGGPVRTYADAWADVPARVLVLGGSESFRADELQADTTAEIRIRYRSGVTTDHHVVHGSTTYEITAVLPMDADTRELRLLCKVIE